LATAEVYNAVDGNFRPIGTMAQGRAGHTAMRLDDGRVLILAPPEAFEDERTDRPIFLYTAATGEFSVMSWPVPAGAQAAATLLRHGRLLITGGDHHRRTAAGVRAVTSADAKVYDLATGELIRTATMINARSGHRTVELPDGNVLIVGGWRQNERVGQAVGRVASDTAPEFVLEAEEFDPVESRFKHAGKMLGAQTGSRSFTTTLLRSDEVLIAGASRIIRSFANGWALANTADRSAELYVRHGRSEAPSEKLGVAGHLAAPE
jgi:hypothetical protein